MKVLYLHQYFATRNSTTSTRAYEFTRKLVENGHEVTVITTDAFLKNDIPYESSRGIKKYNFDGVDVKAVSSNYSNKTSFFVRGFSFINFMFLAERIGGKEKDVDIIFATSTPLTIGIPAMRLSKKLNVPYVFEVRDLWPEAPIQLGAIKSRLLIHYLKKVEYRIYVKAKHIISLSPGMTDGIVIRGVEEGKITLIPNLSNIVFFENSIDTEHMIHLRDKYQLTNKLVLGHIGAMGLANGLDYLVATAEELKKREVDNIVILIVGDGMVKKDLEEIAKEKKLDNIIFTGYIPRNKIPTYTNLVDITITSFLNIPILSTNSPNKFFDSLAAGKPIIVNSSGWTRDIVLENRIGYYVNPEKPKSLMKLLIDLQTDKYYLANLKNRIKKIAKEKYDAEVLSQQFVNTMEQVMEGGK